MNKVNVKIKDWPFSKGERVRLTWIGEPFKYNNKWMVNAYFKGSKTTRKIILDWASIHFLSIDKYYTDGNLNNGEVLENKEVLEINLTGVKAEYKERQWSIWGTGFKEETKSKTFNFYKSGVLYTIPVIEVIRAVLAPDKFMLNRILEMDTLENYFTYEFKGNKLDIHFTSEYDKNLLNSEKINHVAWLLTNPKMFRMFIDIGQNLWQLGELKFDFLIDKFIIVARVEKKEKYVRVLEIVSLKKKRIAAAEINVYHPSLEETQTANVIKKRKFVNKSSSEDRALDSSSDGSTKSSEEISTFLINHEYERVPKINKVKRRRRIRRTKEDENTPKYILEDDKLRTVADTGGEELLKGLEFTNIEKVEEEGELKEFIEILKLIQKRCDIKLIDVIVGDLPEGRKGKKFSKLSDGITRRRYAIGQIVMIDETKYSLIEVQREFKTLSMLLVKAYSKKVNWTWIYSLLLQGLVEGNGKWSNVSIEKIQQKGVWVYRNKHIKRILCDKANFIYKKLNTI